MYYGRQLGMPTKEIEITEIAELRSMIAAMQISEGRAKPKQSMSYEEVLSLR